MNCVALIELPDSFLRNFFKKFSDEGLLQHGTGVFILLAE